MYINDRGMVAPRTRGDEGGGDYANFLACLSLVVVASVIYPFLHKIK